MKRISLAILSIVLISVKASSVLNIDGIAPASLLTYVDEINACFDLDGNGSLDRTELAQFIHSTLYSNSTTCLTRETLVSTISSPLSLSSVDASVLLTPTYLTQIERYF